MRNSCNVREEERKFIRGILCSFIIGLKSEMLEGEFLDIREPGLSLADCNIKENEIGIKFVTIILYFAMIIACKYQ